MIEHHVAIELSAPPGLSPVVDVIDRIPVSDDKSVEVALVTSRPEARGYKQSDRGAPVRGGLRWSVSVPAGAKAERGVSLPGDAAEQDGDRGRQPP